MKITKISFGQGKIRITYLKGENDEEENMVASKEMPTPDFDKALDSIVAIFAEHYVLPEALNDKLTLKDIKFKYNGVNVDKLPFAFRMFANLIYTPSINATAIVKGECIEVPSGPITPGSAFEEWFKVGDNVQVQAMKYINGERAQTKLDYEEEDEVE